MTQKDKTSITLSFWLVAVSGIGLSLTRNFLVVEGSFGPENHFTLPFWKAAHYFLVPYFIFSIGRIYKSHILIKLKLKERKKTGILLIGLLLTVAFTGQLQFLITDLALLENLRLGHLTTGLFSLIVFLYHSRRKVKHLR
ncbi:MAG: hypothetical protein ACPGJV_10735 [Bacteriovoracaceae bacterium]